MRATDAKEFHCSASRTSADSEQDHLELVHQVFEADAATVAMIAQTINGELTLMATPDQAGQGE